MADSDDDHSSHASLDVHHLVIRLRLLAALTYLSSHLTGLISSLMILMYWTMMIHLCLRTRRIRRLMRSFNNHQDDIGSLDSAMYV
eukprot:1343847-Amorphochlora_amoeboformis.AAC.1